MPALFLYRRVIQSAISQRRSLAVAAASGRRILIVKTGGQRPPLQNQAPPIYGVTYKIRTLRYMEAVNSDSRVIQIERLILAVILQEFADGPLDESSKQRLASYHWQEPDHQAIFSALVRFPASHPSITAVELPARLTRLGFPDVECDFLKQPHGLSRSEALNLMAELLGESKK